MQNTMFRLTGTLLTLWIIGLTLNTHFSNVDKIIVPYVLEVKDKLNLPLAQKALVIPDFFSAQVGEDFLKYMLSKILYTYMFHPAVLPIVWEVNLKIIMRIK
jgi:hypothetical protein